MPPQTDTTPIALSPATYERHAAAVEYVESAIRNRDPLFGNGRFPGIVPGRWAIVAMGDTISAGSGTTLGSGVAKLCDKTGTLDDPEVEVDVLNAGSEIDATSGAKIVRLAWTAGDWAVDCPGASA